jgi:hypothetical protein
MLPPKNNFAKKYCRSWRKQGPSSRFFVSRQPREGHISGRAGTEKAFSNSQSRESGKNLKKTQKENPGEYSLQGNGREGPI